MTESDDELVHLREQLAEAQQLNERLEQRLVELIHERSELFHELDVCRAHLTASELTDELRRFGVLDADDEADHVGHSSPTDDV